MSDTTPPASAVAEGAATPRTSEGAADEGAGAGGLATLSRAGLTALDAYRGMATIRRFEDEVLELGRQGHVAGSIHLCYGQEAIPVGTLAALRPGDRVLSTYRGHGWALACGTDPKRLMAEIAQRAEGTNGGRAGSPLLSDPDSGFLGENSIVGAGIPIAAGVALAAKSQGTDRVVAVSIGDGAMNQGATTEGMIFAAAMNLPVVFVCENNGWSEMTPIGRTTRGEHLARRGQGLNIESRVVDGCDPFAVEQAVEEAADLCRNGRGPVLLECKTVRLSGHYNKDIEHYRTDEDRELAHASDPLRRLTDEADDATRGQFEAAGSEIDSLISGISSEVLQGPEPDPGTVYDHLYAADHTPADLNLDLQPAKEVAFHRAINEALFEALAHRPEVLVYGEDVGFAGGIFGVTRGLQKTFGEDRVFDTPIAEAGILGSAVGSAIEGMRPVVEVMWADFLFVALDQVINQASNVRYVNRSRLGAPLTIRTQQGVTPGSCAQHSQSIEAMLAHIPGIKVGLPSCPEDGYSMTRAAIDDPDPTVLIEHRSLYQDKAMVAFGGPIDRAEGARQRRDGSDLVIISWGAMVSKALAAAEELASVGIDATVLDLRWLRPLDEEAISAAVTRTHRVLVVHEAHLSGGFGAEVSSRITERHFADLAAPVTRIGTPDVRMPSAPVLQDAVVPSVADIVEAGRTLVGQ